jgi:hypothetical protein
VCCVEVGSLGPVRCARQTVTARTSVDVLHNLQLYLLPRLEHTQAIVALQQADPSPSPICAHTVRDLLGCCVVQGAPIPWPRRGPVDMLLDACCHLVATCQGHAPVFSVTTRLQFDSRFATWAHFAGVTSPGISVFHVTRPLLK